MDWDGIKNGELLKLLLKHNFDGLITGDKNLQHQQNFAKYPIPVIVLDTKFMTYPFLKNLVPQILVLLENSVPVGPNIIQG
jgi:hypothetical protein